MTYDKKQAKSRYRARQKRIRQRKLREMQHKRSMITVTCIVCLLCVILSVSSFGLYKKKINYENQIKTMKEMVREEELRSEELDELEKYAQTDEYIEDVAREKLGLVYPNEIIFTPK